MNTKKHIVIFSHGFGVRKDDRGLFTDVALVLSGIQTVMFDYNEVDEENNTLTVRPFSKQALMLDEVIKEQKQINPDAVIDLICHSQGCRVAAIVQPVGIRKVILLAPPIDTGVERTLARYKDNPKTKIDIKGITELPRTDGSTTIVPAEYWQERESEILPIELYNQLSKLTEVIIIKPLQDTVLGDASFDGLSDKITVVELDGDHDFTHTRKELCGVVKNLIV